MKITQAKTSPFSGLTGPASGITATDPGGVLGGNTNLNEILQFIAAGGLTGYLTVILGGQGTVQNLGSMGATSTVDLANANYFYGSLTAACTVSFTGWVSGKDCQIAVETTEDGTGTWSSTFSGVTWLGGLTPTPDTAAGTVSIYVFLSRDGGTTIYGALLGGGTSSDDALVPYLLEAGETYTVPVKKQALWNEAITVDAGGSLVVIGSLLMVT